MFLILEKENINTILLFFFIKILKDKVHLPQGLETLQLDSLLFITKSPTGPDSYLITLVGWKSESAMAKNGQRWQEKGKKC